MTDRKCKSASATRPDTPTYWFALLEFAVARGDYETAAECQRNLRRLGVVVYRSPAAPDLSPALGGKGAADVR
jgi:hypothetical protein